MKKEDLQSVRDWADAKIATGEEPPWAWYQYMKLREALDQIIKGMDATCTVIVPEDSRPGALHRGSGHLRLVDIDQQDTALPHQDAFEVPLPT